MHAHTHACTQACSLARSLACMHTHSPREKLDALLRSCRCIYESCESVSGFEKALDPDATIAAADDDALSADDFLPILILLVLQVAVIRVWLCWLWDHSVGAVLSKHGIACRCRCSLWQTNPAKLQSNIDYISNYRWALSIVGIIAALHDCVCYQRLTCRTRWHQRTAATL